MRGKVLFVENNMNQEFLCFYWWWSSIGEDGDGVQWRGQWLGGGVACGVLFST
jgi:hypothetical protein